MKIGVHTAFSGARYLLVLQVTLWGAVAVGQHSVALADYVVRKLFMERACFRLRKTESGSVYAPEINERDG
jgi:hypothetical protein